MNKYNQHVIIWIKYKLVSKALLWSTTLAIILLGLAGGLAELSNVPVYNLQVLEQFKQNANRHAFKNKEHLSRPHGFGTKMSFVY